MTVETASEKRVLCPACGKQGRRVTPVTLRALLKEEYAEGIAPPEPPSCDASGNSEPGCKPANGDTGWRFCDSADCEVVYFAEQNGAAFTKSQLRVPVGVKEKTGERPLCYCFGHSVASIKEELRTKGQSHALEDIRQKMKDLGCRCEVTNPSGSCCLGSVAKGIRLAQEELEVMDFEKQGQEAIVSSSGQPHVLHPSGSRGEKIAKIGTLVSAIAASSCCWLPLVLLAVGTSGAGIAATLEAYRPVFIVVTFGFLAAAFYFTYCPRKTSAGGEGDCCAAEPTEPADDCCGPGGKRRLSMMTMNKIILWVVTALAVAFLFFPNYVGLLLGAGERTPMTANMNRAVVKIEGMTCEGCAAVVEKAIRGVPGVLAVEVSYENGEALVGTESCCPVAQQEIVKALEKAGYTGTFVEDPTGGSNRPPCCP